MSSTSALNGLIMQAKYLVVFTIACILTACFPDGPIVDRIEEAAPVVGNVQTSLPSGDEGRTTQSGDQNDDLSLGSSTVDTSVAAQISDFQLDISGDMISTSFAADKTYLYFFGANGILCRVNRLGGEQEIVFVSKYWPESSPFPSSCFEQAAIGEMWLHGMRQSDEWIVFSDYELALLYTPHTTWAYHMPTGTLKEIEEDEDFSSLTQHAVAGNSVVLVTLDFLEDDPGCQGNSIVTMVDLVTDEKNELFRQCIDETFYYNPFTDVAMTEDWIALVRLNSIARGGNSEIVLWDRSTGDEHVVSGDTYSHYVTMGGDWIAWLSPTDPSSLGPDTPNRTVLYQISTGKSYILQPPYGADEPHIDEGRWLYWRKLINPEPWQTVFDLTTGTMHRFVTDDQERGLHVWRMFDDMIAWSLDNSIDSGDSYTGQIRWRTGADPLELMTVNAPPIPEWWDPETAEFYYPYGLTDLDLSQ